MNRRPFAPDGGRRRARGEAATLRSGGRGVRRGLGLVAVWLLASLAAVDAADPLPVMVQSAPGRFEIAAVDPSLAHAVAAVAEEGWRILATPLGLPAAFGSPVFVRVLPAESGAPPFQVNVEVGGIVSVRVKSEQATASVVRRALVQALIMRVAVGHHGATPQVTSPLWLEQACVGWWESRVNAANLDAVKQESTRLPPPALDALLNWRHGDAEPRSLAVAALWLLTFLQTESGGEREWPEFLRRVTGGSDPAAALALCFPDRFAGADERELWWQTGYHLSRRTRTLPALEAVDSREQLRSLARFVFAAETGDGDRVVPLREVLGRAAEPVVAVDLARRAQDLERLTSQLHPFYRNAGLSLREAFLARNAPAAKREAAVAAFEQDWRDAVELEAATTAALDRWERRVP